MVPLDIVKVSSKHLDTEIGLERLRSDLAANVFALTIAISPDVQNLSISSLLPNIICDAFLVLRQSAFSIVNLTAFESHTIDIL